MKPTNTINYELESKKRAERERFGYMIMGLSDVQLRIHNSNERIDLKSDDVYSEKFPDIVSLLQERKLNETGYYELAFTEGYRRRVEGFFNKIAGFYNQPERAMELLRKKFNFSYRNWEYQIAEIKDLEKFLMTETEMYQRRVQTGTPHTIGILENTLDRTPSSPLFGRPSTQPGLDQIERAMR